ncbi:MAG: 30S ribosomal protein S17 [Acidobacteriota bacterium]
MVKKKKDETEETAGAETIESTEPEVVDAAAAEKKPRKTAAKADDGEESSVLTSVVDAAASVVETVAKAVGDGASMLVEAVAGSPEKSVAKGKRAEKIGVVSSDKMTKTVVVRVDRVVKHPVYRKYVRKRKKFMAHDELGSKIGDKVRIVETRPTSARKRWRVVEIIHKAEL